MFKDIDIFIEQYLDNFEKTFKLQSNIDLPEYLRTEIKDTLVFEINQHINNQTGFEKLTIPAKIILTDWEDYEKQWRKKP